MKNGETWIIETNGGEAYGKDKNIDKNVFNKFNAFKEYAEKYNLNWGFVRDINNRLYLNNIIYTEDMNNDNWVNLEKYFNSSFL